MPHIKHSFRDYDKERREQDLRGGFEDGEIFDNISDGGFDLGPNQQRHKFRNQNTRDFNRGYEDKIDPPPQKRRHEQW